LNPLSQQDLLERLQERLIFLGRRAGRAVSRAFGADAGSGVTRIYVINLDRRPDRWRLMREELARRHAAVDGRHLDQAGVSSSEVTCEYSLAEQLFVQPVSALLERDDLQLFGIRMTAPEIAVALSHVQVWRRIAAGDDAYVLVLEDDAYFTRRFGRAFDATWEELKFAVRGLNFDLLFLSYKEIDGGAQKQEVSDHLFRPLSGIWQLSGYVLSRAGAQRLLELLPVRGPVDVWINHQFERLDVLAMRRPVIRQRPGVTSSNSYSVLPALSAVGVVTREKPLLARPTRLTSPVFASGPAGSGLAELATALSMLGYRCCSDVVELPDAENERLWAGRNDRVFDAYVNVESLTPQHWPLLARRHPSARFISTTAYGETSGGGPDERSLASLHPSSHLTLLHSQADKWQALVDLLACDYPAHAYPDCDDLSEPLVSAPTARGGLAEAATPLRWDRSPWVIPASSAVGFTQRASATRQPYIRASELVDARGQLDDSEWRLRDDTFPSNLCLFRPDNVQLRSGVAEIVLRLEKTPVRDYTSGAIAAKRRHIYGRYSALLKPAGVPGLVTGVFLHRDAPRQEIDLEFLGKDPRRILVNVYYNPGCEGTRLQYGYRGTPTLIDLGFDASEDFHLYEIEWQPDVIRWRVDEQLVHERYVWEPTPIPNLPAEFNLNLWHSRSTELAGRLSGGALPARAQFQDVRIWL
jgi:GR25 family glycosyltransferase involved in LPS biosynthesis